MSRSVTLRPGAMRLDDWRQVATGAAVTLDPACLPLVDAAAATVAAMAREDHAIYGINTGFGRLANTRISADDLERLQRNLVLSHACGVGPALEPAVVRLIVALKIASLGRGASGVRRIVVERLQDLLDRDLIPVIPAQGSVGASGDLAPLAHLAAVLLGEGNVWRHGRQVPAAQAVAAIELGPKEGLALINGTQVSTALALTGLFAAERVVHSALVTGALAVDAALGSDAPFDHRIHELRGHRGQIDVAASLRALIEGSEIRESHRDCGKVQDPYSLRCQPQVMGAVLDLLRHAARTLQTEADAVSDNPLVFVGEGTAPGEVLSGGNFHAEPVAFAADIIALATAETASLTERRIAMLTDGSISGLPPFLTREPGVNSGFMIAHVTAAALAAETKQRATPASIDSLPTSANQEDHVSMATHGARRLLDMTANAAGIVAIELLAATQGIDFHAPLRSSPRLERVRQAVRTQVAHLDEDRLMAPDIAAAKGLVDAGALAAAVGHELLPEIDP